MSQRLPCFFILGVFKEKIHSRWRLPSCDGCFKKHIENVLQPIAWQFSFRDTPKRKFRQFYKGYKDGRILLASAMYVEEDRLKTYVNFTNVTNVNQIDCQEILRELSAGTVPAIVLHHLTFFTPVVPQLQLWHFYWLVSVQTVSDLHSQIPTVFTHPVSRRRCFKRRNTLASDWRRPE